MQTFQKPNAYKNVSASEFTNINKIKSTTQTRYQRLLDQITSHSPDKGTCTCS